MRFILAGIAALVTFTALADVTIEERTQVALLRGSNTVAQHTSWEACLADARTRARAETQTSGTRTFTCQTERRQIVATYSPNQPPPPPDPDPPTNLGDNGTDLTWTLAPNTPAGTLLTLEQRPTGCNDSSQPFAVVSAAVAGTSYSIRNLAPGTYTWRLRITGGSPTEYSNEWCKTITAPEPPPPPTGAATLENLAPRLAQIPWNNASGGWGAQVRLELPAQPVTNRRVTVNSVASFNAAAAVAGTHVVVGGSWSSNSTATINASNIDVEIPAGMWIGAIEVGVWPRTTSLSRIRIRGAGRMGQYRDNEYVSDVTIDGPGLNGASAFGGAETNQAFRVGSNRLAVLNARVLSGFYCWLGDARHVVIANTNMLCSAASVAQLGSDPGGWAIRNTKGPITVLDSRLQGTRYALIRLQASGSNQELFYGSGLTLVNTGEPGRTGWLWNNQGNGNFYSAGAILENSTVISIAPSGCAPAPDLQAPHARYSRVRGNRFLSNAGIISQATLNNAPKMAGGDHDWQGNTFGSISSLPPWVGPGDPTPPNLSLPGTLSLVWGNGACNTPR
jgi:hypothetical protein